jgi:hypothetical protein
MRPRRPWSGADTARVASARSIARVRSPTTVTQSNAISPVTPATLHPDAIRVSTKLADESGSTRPATTDPGGHPQHDARP